MPDTNRTWKHAGISEVNDDGRIRVPDEIFQEQEILSVGSPVHFSYDKVVGILIASNRELEKDGYKTEGFRKLGGDNDNFRVTIPSQYFEDKTEQGDPAVTQEVPEKARVEPGEQRHFVYHTGMAEGSIRSCYLLTDNEFDKRFSDSDRWDGTLDQVPRFIS